MVNRSRLTLCSVAGAIAEEDELLRDRIVGGAGDVFDVRSDQGGGLVDEDAARHEWLKIAYVIASVCSWDSWFCRHVNKQLCGDSDSLLK